MESIKTFYYKYRNIILFNKNLILAGIITAVADIFIVNYASSIFVSSYLIISGMSLICDFLIYNILFIIFYFFDNRSQYINSYRIKNKQKLKQDLKKLITVIGFAEISYLTMKFFYSFIQITKYTFILSIPIDKEVNMDYLFIYCTSDTYK